VTLSACDTSTGADQGQDGVASLVPDIGDRANGGQSLEL